MAAEDQSIRDCASEYAWLRQQGALCLELDDENGFEQAYGAAEVIRERIFSTPTSTPTAGLEKLRFVVLIARERSGDRDTGVVGALADILAALESRI